MSDVIQTLNSSLIILTDDDPFMRQMLSMALTQEGYQVIATANGQDGFEAFATNQHASLILLDCQMPIMDGFTCCAYLQQQFDMRYTPILMITGLDDQPFVDRAFEVGAADYVTKPVHWPILRQRVRLTVERSQLMRELDSLKRQAQTA
jgi:PleD family two-component response regulator